MSDKFVFQNARIKSMEQKLMTSQYVQRLLECASTDDAFRLLTELGYGAGTTLENNKFDDLFYAEESAAVTVLRNFNVDGELDAFLLENDYNNLKALLKAAVTEVEPAVLMPYGLFEIDKLKTALAGDLSAVSDDIGEVIKNVEKLISEERITPHALDVAVDKAKFINIFKTVKKRGALQRSYFIKKTDYINILAFLRCRKLNLDEKFFLGGFIEGGELKAELFTSCYDGTIELFKEKCRYTHYRTVADAAAEGADVVQLEVTVDNELFKIWKDERDDMFSEAPVVAFYLSKLTEIKVAKLIVAGIKNHVDPQLIKERMREIYA